MQRDMEFETPQGAGEFGQTVEGTWRERDF